MIRIGFVCSSGGAVFATALKILRSCGYDVQAAVVVDRECGAEKVCSDIGVPYIRIEEPDNQMFSFKSAIWLYEEHKVEWTALFFSRLVGEPLYLRAPCVNYHPSLLPAFPGFGALKNIKKYGVKLFGATAHLVDSSIDGGKILAQVVSPVPEGAALNFIERISFAQKLYLLLLTCCNANEKQGGFLKSDWFSEDVGSMNCNYANPKIIDTNIEKAFLSFIESEGIPWPILKR
jgi:phosphoribosylglycinamide formyltransferase-1